MSIIYSAADLLGQLATVPIVAFSGAAFSSPPVLDHPFGCNHLDLLHPGSKERSEWSSHTIGQVSRPDFLARTTCGVPRHGTAGRYIRKQ